MEIELRGEPVWLDKERAAYFVNSQLLAISDLHLGKAAHFRKAGLPVPTTVATRDLNRLSALLEKYKPKQLLVNGDMFHSDYNQEIDDFYRWKQNYPGVKFILVKGNHDKQLASVYQNLGIALHQPAFCTSNFCFIHDALKCTEKNLYPIGGHLHPGIGIYNHAKQRLKFPCFYFGETHAILPAFSIFTGLAMIKTKKNDQVVAITPNNLIKV